MSEMSKVLNDTDGHIMKEILKELKVRNAGDGRIKDYLTEEDLDIIFERVEDFLPEDGIFWKKIIFAEESPHDVSEKIGST
jgi:hypothetical protein